MAAKSNKQLLAEDKEICERKGYCFSVRNFWDGKLAFDAIREQWFPRIEFIDVHQAHHFHDDDVEIDFHNQGINPDYQDHSSDMFMQNLN